MIYTKFLTIFLLSCYCSFFTFAQDPCYWQQEAHYVMQIDFNVNTHRFTGKQTITYINRSPDTLKNIFYHLYFNAFQPGSMMDVRVRTISDSDSRTGGKILSLKENEIGYQKILSLKQDKQRVDYQVVGTILEVSLANPVFPNKTTVLDMQFEAQVPIQIRRSGRDNSEGIAYSMTQWYPKLCEYDKEGWHANPYIGREFHGIWGNFDVKIEIDSSYTVAATGHLQQPETIGHGYATVKTTSSAALTKNENLLWHFKAQKIHDFAWAADPNYTHTSIKVPQGPKIHFFYKKSEATSDNWKELPSFATKTIEILNEKFGIYPYSTYSVIQGGDGGMEYPMATLITGHRPLESLIGVTVHEIIHSWFQMLLATNEAKYAWMDEGFTTYGTDYTMNILLDRKKKNPHDGSYRSYFYLVKSGLEEPSSVHADHFQTNRAYGASAYSKGAVFLHQLSYIIGQKAFDEGMKNYYYTWRFKHPTPTDFKRIMEKISGIELDWYFEYWIHTTNTINYAIKNILSEKKSTTITLENKGSMPMPLDVAITYKTEKTEYYYIPLRIMRGEKQETIKNAKRILQPDWPWVYPEYELTIKAPLKNIKRIEIDPSLRMADIDRNNNVYPNKTPISFQQKD